jgi:hypothetical protein
MTLTETLEAAITAAQLKPEDQAAAQLARIYATQIETAVIKKDSKTIGDLGAKLLSTLTALGMTHAGRAVKTQIEGGAANDDDTSASTLQRLRASVN